LKISGMETVGINIRKEGGTCRVATWVPSAHVDGRPEGRDLGVPLLVEGRRNLRDIFLEGGIRKR